jgi:hypothetical protein
MVGRKYVTEKSSDTTGNRSQDRPTISKMYLTETYSVNRAEGTSAHSLLEKDEAATYTSYLPKPLKIPECRGNACR